MHVRERSRRVRAAILILAAAGGTAAALGGCGRSGPLHLPKESSLAAPAPGPAAAAAVVLPRRPSAPGRDLAAPAPASAPFASLPGPASSAAPSPHRGLATVPRRAAVFLPRG